jgi:Tfp pilus assembly protein PilF
LTGSLLAEAILMAFLAVEWGRRLAKKLKGEGSYIMAAVMTAVFTLILALAIVKIQKTGWVVLDASSSWVIAVESFKRNPITGIGIGNFSTAFNLYRPASYNTTKYWTSGFNMSINGWLQLWTELGIVGLVLIILTILLVVRQKKDANWVRLMLMLLAFLFLPVNLMIWWLLMWLLVSYDLETKKAGLVLRVGESGINAMPWIVAVVLVAAMGWSGFNLGKVVAADYYYRLSLVAASKNDGGTTYNQQIKAIGINPLVSEYRRVYAQTNLALAVSLLSNKDITDADKEKASVLIQQSVREGKAAVSLDQMDVANWTNLAQIYRQIIGVVDGSADWSYQAYQQAVVLDPTNPSLDLDMGGLLYAAGRYEEADRLFEQTVTNKPDFANGWYNWAYNAKQMNRLADAVQRLNQAVTLVPVTSADYEKANGELTAWKKEYDEAVKKQQAVTGATPTPTPKPETLKAPAPQPTVGKEEKVNVPAEDLAPPTPAATVVPTESPTGGP